MAEQSLCVSLALQNMRGQAASGKKVIKQPKMPQVWRQPLADEVAYAVQIGRIVQEFTAIVNTELLRYPTWARQDGLKTDAFADDWDKVMKALRDHQKKTFEQGDGAATYAMVSNVGQNAADFNFKEWSKQLSALAGQPYFPAGEGWVSQTVGTWSDLNFELIRSLTDDYIKKVNTTVVNAVTDGTNYRDLTKQILAVNQNMSKARAKLIARDQVGKLNGQLTKRRQSDAGVDDYTWKTANDERVRSKHRNMQGKTCEWNDASKVKVGTAWSERSVATMPSGHPGYEIQCRCYATPNMDEIWKEAEDIAKAEGWYPGEEAVPGLTVKPRTAPPVAPVVPAAPPKPLVPPKPVSLGGLPTAPPGTKMPPDYYPAKGVNQVVEYSKKTRLYYRTTSSGRRTHVWNMATGTWNELGVVPGTAVPVPTVAPAAPAKPVAAKTPKVPEIKNADSLRAYAEAPDYIKKAVAKAESKFKGTVPPVTDSGAYYSGAIRQIHMGAKYKPASEIFDTVWRHEMGHHVDNCLTGARIGSKYGSKKSFKLRDELKALQKKSKAAQKTPATDDVLDKKARELGFDGRHGLRDFFRSHGVGDVDSTLASRRFLSGDLQGFIESLPHSRTGSHDWTAMADTIGSLTKGEHGWGHTKSYYARSGNPETEIFADFMDLLGGKQRKQWEPIMKELLPDTHAKFVDIVTQFGGA